MSVNEHLPLTVRWTVPSGQVWRDLDTIDIRIAYDDAPLFGCDGEAGNTFSLCRSSADDPTPDDGTCDMGGTAGSRTVLQTSLARLHLGETTATGSGPLGQDVTLVLDVSFKGGAGTETFDVAVAASDGSRQPRHRFPPRRVDPGYQVAMSLAVVPA